MVFSMIRLIFFLMRIFSPAVFLIVHGETMQRDHWIKKVDKNPDGVKNFKKKE